LGLTSEPTHNCRVAIIGAGNMALAHALAFKDVPGVSVCGIHSRSRPRAEKIARDLGISDVYDSIPELYERTRADLVVVTVNETSANAISRASFEFPWTVLLEKPPGYNLADAEDIQNAARAKGSRVLVALNRRFLSSTRTALAQLSESIGPRFIAVQDQQDPTEAARYGLDPLVIANLMYANSIHLIDYLCVFGRDEITCVTPVIRWNPEAPNVVAAKVEFKSGDTGIYVGIWKGPGPWAVAVNTSERRWEMRPLEQLVFQNRGERGLQPVEIHRWDTDFKPGFRLQAEMAVRAALGKPSDSPTLDEAMRTMRLIQNIFA
jgi:predicted dehydrogenase